MEHKPIRCTTCDKSHAEHMPAINNVAIKVEDKGKSKPLPTKLLICILYAAIAIEVIAIIFNGMQYHLLADFQAGIYTSTHALIKAAEASDYREHIISLFQLGILIASVIVFSIWIYRANKNLRNLGTYGMTISPGWSVGYYFIPILNLWRPYSAMKEIWRASKHPKSWKEVKRGSILPWWWGLWLLNGWSGMKVLSMSKDAKNISELTSLTVMQIVSSIVYIVLIVLAIILVKQISDMQNHNPPNNLTKINQTKQHNRAKQFNSIAIGVFAGIGSIAIIILLVLALVPGTPLSLTSHIVAPNPSQSQHNPITQSAPKKEQITNHRKQATYKTKTALPSAKENQLKQIHEVSEKSSSSNFDNGSNLSIESSNIEQDTYASEIVNSALAGKPLTAQQIYKKCATSVVVIKSPIKNKNELSQGSGVVIHKEVVVSNYHVIKDVDIDDIHVFYKKKKYKATIRYANPAHDLCSFNVKGLKAPPVDMGATSEIEKGEKAYAIGAPEGLSLTISDGIISGLRKMRDGTYIQTTAAISHGSSGGGLFDSQGRLVGITFFYIKGGNQLNFSYPVMWIKSLKYSGMSQQKLAKSNSKISDKLAQAIREFFAQDYQKALSVYGPLANQGNTGAQYIVGSMYLYGINVSQNYKKAFRWYKKAAEKGNVKSQYIVGFMYYIGKGVTQNYKKAFHWYENAAHQEYPQAQFFLGSMYEHGQGILQNYDHALYWYQKATEQGFAAAQFNLGQMYYKGRGVPQDYTKAAYWYQRVAKQGFAIAQNNLGDMYAKGKGVAQNYKKSHYWYKKAAEQGDAVAQYNLGLMYYYAQGVPQNYSKAYYWCYKAAERGIVNAQVNLGFMYNHGQGVAQNYKKSRYWYKKAAEQGDAVAQYNLGNMYTKGRGVPQNSIKAAYWYQKAAKQEFTIAQFNLGGMYRKGEGVQQDYRKAFYWYQKAAKKGLAKARVNLGLMYYKGRGVPQDFSKAFSWYHKAAKQGFARGQLNLSSMYALGEGVPQNYVKAAKWAILANAGEDKHADKLFSLIKKKITSQQVTKAKKLAKQWQKIHNMPRNH